MSTVLYEDDKVRFCKVNDNGFAVESKISDPAELSVSVDADKLEANLGKVRFDVRRSDGVHEELGYIMGRAHGPDKREGIIAIAVRGAGEEQSPELVFIGRHQVLSSIPVYAPNIGVGAPASNRLYSNRYVYQLQDDEAQLPYGTIIVYDTVRADGKPAASEAEWRAVARLKPTAL